MNILQAADILAWNLWGNDDTDYRVLRNVMLTTRCRHDCAICLQAITAGSSTEAYDGACKTFYVCPTCCEAILLDQRDGDCLHIAAGKAC